VLGPGHDGTIMGLKLTARWSYCFFLPAYAGGALAAVFGPLFQPLAKRARDLGLAFACAHLAHLSLVAWIYHIATRAPIPTSSVVIFSIGAAFTYLLALSSFPRASALLPPRALRIFRTVAMEYIALIFLIDFLHEPFGHGLVNLALYLPFIVLAFAAALVRLLAYSKRVSEAGRPESVSLTPREQLAIRPKNTVSDAFGNSAAPK
jgi:hypothetical protein